MHDASPWKPLGVDLLTSDYKQIIQRFARPKSVTRDCCWIYSPNWPNFSLIVQMRTERKRRWTYYERSCSPIAVLRPFTLGCRQPFQHKYGGRLHQSVQTVQAYSTARDNAIAHDLKTKWICRRKNRKFFKLIWVYKNWRMQGLQNDVDNFQRANKQQQSRIDRLPMLITPINYHRMGEVPLANVCLPSKWCREIRSSSSSAVKMSP